MLVSTQGSAISVITSIIFVLIKELPLPCSSTEVADSDNYYSSDNSSCAHGCENDQGIMLNIALLFVIGIRFIVFHRVGSYQIGFDLISKAIIGF